MQNEIKSGIYCIENITTNKKYIGQSIDINDRWRKHISELNHSSHHNDYLQKAWNKYGENDFKFYVLEYCSDDELDKKEIYYINLYNTIDRKYGYNLKTGGQANCHHTDEVKNKISESNKKAYQNQELRDIRSNDALKQWSNPEIKEKIMGSNNGMYGKHHTEETKQKMRKNRSGIPSHRRNTTPVFCIELNQKFDDATEAGKELSLDSSAILKVCQGKRKTCGGYHWNFLNTRENNISKTLSVRQNVTQGVAFRVDTSWYVIKVYTEFELFMLGRIDWAELIDRMSRSIEQYRYNALYNAFMSMDESLPTDMILETPLSESTKDAVVDQIEAVKAATGYDVVLVGTRTAIQKLQNTVNYNMWSNDMKNERYQNGILGNWEGYTCLPLSRVNISGTRDSVFSADDNKKIFILPVDPQFKPIKQVWEGDLELVERNTTGNENMDRTMEASIWYREGVGVVINQLFGEIKIATSVSA